jgi:hypothetical protein
MSQMMIAVCAACQRKTRSETWALPLPEAACSARLRARRLSVPGTLGRFGNAAPASVV